MDWQEDGARWPQSGSGQRSDTEHEGDNPTTVSVASLIGSAVETYDFFIFGTASAAYFGSVFFEAENQIVGTMASFATLAIGFLFRPLGGFLAGHYGDRLGRKRVLLWSLVVMGVATVLIGALPTYAQVGTIAPILLIMLRIVQGIGFGAEWGGAVLMAVEHSPPRRRGLFGAVPQIGIPIGLLMANGSFYISSSLLDGDWVWRAPFLASAVMVGAGLFIRLRISESPEFSAMQGAGEIRDAPALDVVRQDWRSILKIVGLRMADAGGFYITTSFLMSYVGLAAVGVSNDVLVGTLIGSAIGLISLPVFGALSDRIGRRKIFLFGSVFTIGYGIPLFFLVNTGSAVAIAVAVVLGLVLSHDPNFAVEPAWFSEQFPRAVRSSGISLGYNGATVVAGALPFLATALYAGFGWWGPAILFSLCGIASTVACQFVPETAPNLVAAEVPSSMEALRPRVH